MADAVICPHCGFDLALDGVIHRPEIFFDPRGDIMFRGKLLALTPAERIVLGTLLREAGRYVGAVALRERIGSEAEGNVVTVMISKIRAKLRAIDPSRHWIENKFAEGWRWASGTGWSEKED